MYCAIIVDYYCIINPYRYVFVSRIVTEKPHQGSVNKVLCCNPVIDLSASLDRIFQLGAYPKPSEVIMQLRPANIVQITLQM